MPRHFTTAETAATYVNHPQRAEALLAHVRARRGSLDGIAESDLARGEEPWTDQNHPGGADAVEALADRLAIGPGDLVLDVGSGLGGPARLLADRRGCRVVGVELTEPRHRDATLLTARTGLDDRVRLVLGDFLAVDPGAGPFDVIIGLACFNHFADPDALLARCAGLIKPGGRLAFEDVDLRRPPGSPAEAADLDELAARWTSHFAALDTWRARLARAGFAGPEVDDITPALLADQEARFAAAEAAPGAIDALEVRGWELGLRAVRAGLIGYVRVIARLRPSTP